MRKYKVRDIDDTASLVEGLLEARGVKDARGWINATKINDWRGLDDMEEAVALVKESVEDGVDICVPVDCDCDGFSSAAILINFLIQELKVPESRIAYLVHDGKAHGLADLMPLIPDGTGLVLMADAGTSDYEEQDALASQGCKVCILDHHQAEYKNDNPDVVTVNDQLDNYPDKALTGAGVAWQFTRAYMEIVYGKPDYMCDIDLCAFGNVSDMADYREPEIRAIVNLGFSSLKNKFLAALAKQNEYTMNKHGGLCYRGCAFGLTPFVNAICRSGTIDEKRFVFESMLDHKGDTLVPSGKRGSGGELVPMCQEAVRIVSNVKARQTQEQNQMVDDILAKGELLDDINVVICDSDTARPELAGVVANKLQDSFCRPAIVLLDYPDERVYRGSARNCDGSPIEDFRLFCEDSGNVNYAAGHPSAFGVEIPYDDMDDFLCYCGESGFDFESGSAEVVDFKYPFSHMDNRIFAASDTMKKFLGQQIPAVKVVVTSVPISSCGIYLMSPDKSPTLKIVAPNGVQFLKYKSNQDEVDSLKKLTSTDTLDVIGEPSINRWNDKSYNQIVMSEYSIREEWVF